MMEDAMNRGIMGALAAVALMSTYLGTIVTCEAQGLQANDSQLKSIEELFAQIGTAKTDGDKDKFADKLESQLSTYTKGMVASFGTALKQAELAAKSKGKEGNVEELKAFEDLAVRHENKLKQLEEQGKKMKSGSILEPAEVGKVALDWRLLDKIGDFFISPAEAAIALAVYNVCHGLNSSSTPAQWAACNQAIAAAGPQRSAAQAAYNACWNGYEDRRPKWWRAILRASCVVVLVARLA
jgi:hypothetical protein